MIIIQCMTIRVDHSMLYGVVRHAEGVAALIMEVAALEKKHFKTVTSGRQIDQLHRNDPFQCCGYDHLTGHHLYISLL